MTARPDSAESAVRPNVLIFCVDEMRADHMACAGNRVVQTPAIDRIAARGVHFRAACCNNPICMPARASMFTGLLPRDHGLRVNGQSLRTDLASLPGLLAEAGHRTHAAGKLHLTPWVPRVDPPDPQSNPEALAFWQNGRIRKFPEPYYGFQTVDFVGGHSSYAYGDYIEYLRSRGGDPALLATPLETPSGAPSVFKMALDEELHYNRYIADSVIRVIEESAGGPVSAGPVPDQRHTSPFFAWASFPDPHLPVAPPRPWCDMYAPEDIDLPVSREGELDDLPSYIRDVMSGEYQPNNIDNSIDIPDAHWRELIAGTYGMISHLDNEIGRVLDALDRTGQTDNTIIVFISDHGDMMGDHGLLWKGPYTFNGCIRIPLIIAAPGLTAGASTERLACQIDLLPTIIDICGLAMPDADWEEYPTPFQRGCKVPLQLWPGRSLRPTLTDPSTATREEVVIENDDITSGYNVRCLVTESHRFAILPGTGEGELFDLRNDPHELHNLWNSPAHAGIRAELTACLLDAYARETPWTPIPPWNS